MQECLAASQIRSCFVVGHDFGGLIALELASRAPSVVKGISVVSSVAAAPTGDGAENLTLAYPPVPLWTRNSQRWAFEQLSYSHDHITDELLDTCVSAAQQPSHLKVAAAVREGSFQNEFIPSLMRSQGALLRTLPWNRHPGAGAGHLGQSRSPRLARSGHVALPADRVPSDCCAFSSRQSGGVLSVPRRPAILPSDRRQLLSGIVTSHILSMNSHCRMNA